MTNEIDIKKIKRGRPKKIVDETIFTKTHHNYEQNFLIILNITEEDIIDYKNTHKIYNAQTQQIQPHQPNQQHQLNNSKKYYDYNILTMYVGNIPLNSFDNENNENNDFKPIIQLSTTSNQKKKNSINTICPLLYKENNDKWPESSPYLCWYCTCNFDTMPIGIPLYEDINNNIYCEGNYCTTSCAYKDLICNVKYNNDKEKKIELLYKIHYIIYGNYNLTPSYDKILLEKFGGNKTENEYQKLNNTENNYNIEIYKLPIVPHMLKIIEYEKNCNTIISNQNTYKNEKKQFIPIDIDKLQKSKELYNNIIKKYNL